MPPLPDYRCPAFAIVTYAFARPDSFRYVAILRQSGDFVSKSLIHCASATALFHAGSGSA